MRRLVVAALLLATVAVVATRADDPPAGRCRIVRDGTPCQRRAYRAEMRRLAPVLARAARRDRQDQRARARFRHDLAVRDARYLPQLDALAVRLDAVVGALLAGDPAARSRLRTVRRGLGRLRRKLTDSDGGYALFRIAAAAGTADRPRLLALRRRIAPARRRIGDFSSEE